MPDIEGGRDQEEEVEGEFDGCGDAVSCEDHFSCSLFLSFTDLKILTTPKRATQGRASKKYSWKVGDLIKRGYLIHRREG
jgi:hypothetical protein